MLSYDEHGRGEALVLLHGIPGSRATWNAVVPLLPRGLRILVPDLLGFGSSPDASGLAHAFEQAAAVLRMLDDARVTSAHFAGFDFGGPVAVATHALAAQRVRSLTLLATNLLTDTPVPFPLRIARRRFLGDVAFRVMFSGLGLRAMWRAAVVDRAALPFHAFRATSDARGLRETRRIFLASLRDLQRLYAPIEETLQEVRVPVTLIWGDRDPFFPRSAGERTAARFEAASFVMLGQCGHFLPLEQPREVAAATAETVERASEPSNTRSAR